LFTERGVEDGETSMTRHIRWIAVALFVAGCGAGTPAPSASAVPASAPASGAQIVLQTAPGDLGCDTIGVDYREVTFQIDPAAAEQVTALASTGTVLHTFWAAGFRGGSAADKTVLDPTGAVVVTDGEKLAIPAGAFPRLKGYFVCPSPDALYILAADPQ
jgi:hypothetical protein